MLATPRRVILHGNSLILQGVCAVLRGRPEVELHWLDPALEEPLAGIRACCPAMFIFDLSAAQPGFQLALLQQPGLLLVGIEPETHQAVVWSGRHEAAVEATDLLQLLNLIGGQAPQLAEGGKAKP